MGVTFGKSDEFWKKQVDKIFTVVLGYKTEKSGGHTVTWREGGKLKEEFEYTLNDAREELKTLFHQAQKQGKQVTLSAEARRLFTGKPTRYDVKVETWEERDRLHIWVHYKDDHPLYPGKDVAEWWDDDARQMFEDGFFKRELVPSVLLYCQEMGILEKE